MGSTGSGRFSDYPGSGGNGSEGGPADDDRCNREFRATLEDVEHSDYFTRTSTVPPQDTKLTLEHHKRIVAVDESGVTVGSLPTSHNYLAECLVSGFTYTGIVSASSNGPVVRVDVYFIPAP